jgi:hypothetical protein
MHHSTIKKGKKSAKVGTAEPWQTKPPLFGVLHSDKMGMTLRQIAWIPVEAN